LSDEESFAASSDAGREVAMDMGTDSGSEEDDHELSLYPLEGKYKDHADKARLLAMTEIDREAVLAERAAQIEREGQDRHLRNLFKARKAADRADAAASTRKSLRTKSAPKKTEEATKRGKLDELRRTREERKATGRRNSFGDEDASKKMLSEGEEDYNDDSHRPRDERPITLDDVNRCRIGRTALAKYFDYPGFEDVIPDVFVRVTMWDKETQKNVYRMAQIKGTACISSITSAS
jgi:RNA polymerase-associated protein RTF1